MNQFRIGMAGLGMIFEETYARFFERTAQKGGLHHPKAGLFNVSVAGCASRTGKRARGYQQRDTFSEMESFAGENSAELLLSMEPDAVCVATPDDRHFEIAKAALEKGKHTLIEKPSVLTLQQLDELAALAEKNDALAKVVYHKLFDPDHKKLRTLVSEEKLQHVNNGYCSLLEPKSISSSQFAQWIEGRNPGTYVAVHYIKLIDFTFGGRLKEVSCTGQRGIVAPHDSSTWDSTQLRLVYEYESGREGAFDIHTSWVTPDNFPGYVEQEVQFRFDNGVWNGHSRRRGVECTIEEETPLAAKISLNNHYSTEFLEPWNQRSYQGYGIDAIEQFFMEAADVEFGGPDSDREIRLARSRELLYNDLSADRQVVAAIQAMEWILEKHALGEPGGVVKVNSSHGGLALFIPGVAEPDILYKDTV